MVIDFTAERRAREEEAKAAKARAYLIDQAAHIVNAIADMKSSDAARQLVMDLMNDPLTEELYEMAIIERMRRETP